MTMYTANLSFALILLAIFNANSIGIKLLAPDQNSNPKESLEEEFDEQETKEAIRMLSLNIVRE